MGRSTRQGFPTATTLEGRSLGHDASCTYNYIVADGNSRENDGAGAYPAISADMNGHVILIRLFSELRQNGMPAVATVTFGPNIV